MTTIEILQHLAVVIAASLLFSKILGKLRFPDVTGYLIGGIIIGPMVLNLIPKDAVHGLEIISEVALAIIAYSIGSEMKLSALKKTGKGVLLITFLEVFMAFLVVFLSLWLVFKQDFSFSIVLGSIACATAPAATLLVIRQYKAKGPVVDTLIPVVALDDAFCIIAFGICSSIAQAIIGGETISALALVEPVKEILLSTLLGFVYGIVSIYIIKALRNEGELTSFVLGSIFILTSVSIRYGLSSLLVMMSFGLAMTNLSRKSNRATTALDGMVAPLFMCFFTLSGADLDFSVFKTVGIVAVVYVIARVIGKMIGAGLGAKLSRMGSTVQKYLGLTLIPQAGVAIGLSLAATKILGMDHGSKIRAIILAGTVIYELIGPVTTKIALTKAGEIEKASASR
ncbi:MAG: cation:proton antiporter [Bacillota bacterium]|nr:cation:proton antiporter [Bacillota bacterium]